MQLKVIDKNKVKILFEDKDFDEFTVPEDITDCNDSVSREFILKLLGEIYLQTGINFLSSKVLIEVVPGVSTAFYIIITRLQNQETDRNQTLLKADEDMYLFKLCQAENIFDISECIKNKNSLKIGESKLYKYKNKYYLAIYFPPETVSDSNFGGLIKKITAYSEKCKWNILNEPILEEHGELLVKDPLNKINS